MFWTKFGKLWAIICSFYELIRLHEFKVTLIDIMEPFVNIVLSPFSFIKGYLAQKRLYDHPYMITFGTMTIISVCVWIGIQKFGLHLTEIYYNFSDFLNLKVVRQCTERL